MNQRLRIVHITGCLDIGGQEKLLVEFARHADRDRFDLRFVSLGTRGILAAELEALGWPVTALDLAPGLHWRLPMRLAKLLRGWNADLVHTHNDRPLIYAAPAARLARIAGVVHTRHGRGTGNSRRQNVLASLAARLADHFVCVSNDCAELAIAQGIPRGRLCTLHNGIDTARFSFAGPNPHGPAVIVARLCEDKDLTTLLHAVRRVVPHAPDFRLALAGDGPLREVLQGLAQALRITDHVQFLGAVRDVPALLKSARLFVLSSVSEGVPLTLLEAMATGLPTIATRVGGIPEVVVEDVTSVLVRPRDPQALADALLRLYRDPDLGRTIGAAARQHVEDHFDIRSMVQYYEQLYLSTCGQPPHRQAVGDHSQVNPEEVPGCASHI